MTTKMMNCWCRKCKEVFTIPARRGRPPFYCDKCLGTAKTDETEEGQDKVSIRWKEEEQQRKEALALARVIALERQLKLFGRHISQHRHKWE